MRAHCTVVCRRASSAMGRWSRIADRRSVDTWLDMASDSRQSCMDVMFTLQQRVSELPLVWPDLTMIAVHLFSENRRDVQCSCSCVSSCSNLISVHMSSQEKMSSSALLTALFTLPLAVGKYLIAVLMAPFKLIPFWVFIENIVTLWWITIQINVSMYWSC